MNPKPAAVAPKPVAKADAPKVVAEVEIKKETKTVEKTVVPKPVGAEKVVLENDIKTPAEPVAAEGVAEEPAEFTTQYQKLSGATLTGQVIDLAQFNKPKKKIEAPKINVASKANDANKNKRKRIEIGRASCRERV